MKTTIVFVTVFLMLVDAPRGVGDEAEAVAFLQRLSGVATLTLPLGEIGEFLARL